MEEFKIVRAERTQARLRLAFQGPSGGGKTATSLLTAKGMVEALRARGKLPAHLDGVYIGLLDTERDSAKLYSHLVPFDTLVLEPPYSPKRYLGALRALERVGYPIIILDQITHEWYGEGGVLQMVQANKGQNDWAKWNGPSQDHDAFIDGLLSCPAHLIATMRSKTEYVLEQDDRGKYVPKRIGMAAKQREGTEYEFTTLLDLEVGTNAVTCLKDRTELFTVGAKIGRMGPDWGERLIDWVYSAKKPEAAPEASPAMKALGACEAGIRAMERCLNAPDLAKAFLEAQKAVKAHNVTAGADVVVPLLERLVAAKDQRKTAISAAPDNPTRAPDPADLISAEDACNLEIQISDCRIDGEALKERFGIFRLAQMPLAKWDEAQAWIVEAAAKNGSDIAPLKHTPGKKPEPGPVEILNGIVDKIGASRPGLFSDLKDDTAGIV